MIVLRPFHVCIHAKILLHPPPLKKRVREDAKKSFPGKVFLYWFVNTYICARMKN